MPDYPILLVDVVSGPCFIEKETCWVIVIRLVVLVQKETGSSLQPNPALRLCQVAVSSSLVSWWAGSYSSNMAERTHSGSPGHRGSHPSILNTELWGWGVTEDLSHLWWKVSLDGGCPAADAPRGWARLMWLALPWDTLPCQKLTEDSSIECESKQVVRRLANLKWP